MRLRWRKTSLLGAYTHRERRGMEKDTQPPRGLHGVILVAMISSKAVPSGSVSAQFNQSEPRHDTHRGFVPCACMGVCSSARRGGGVWSCLVRVPAIHAFQLDASCSYVEKWQVLTTSLVHSTVRSGAEVS